MYTNIHATAGTLIVLATHAVTQNTETAIALGGALAFLSHDPIDRLGEKNYGSMEISLRWEGVALAVFAIVAYLSGQWPLFAVGWIAGNGMDLIDKKLGLAIAFPDKFKFGYFFKCHRRAPNIKLTLGQTKLAAVLASVAITTVTILVI